MIGYGVGSFIYEKRNIKDMITPWQVNTLRKGQKIIVCKYDSSQYTGKYYGTTEIPIDKYDEVYSTFRNKYAVDSLIPNLGDTIEIFNTHFKTHEYAKLVAFESASLRLTDLKSGIPFSVEPKNNTIVNFKNSPFYFASYPDLPRITLLQLKIENDLLLNFKLEEVAYIRHIYRKPAKHAKIVGLVCGAVFDIAFVTIMTIAIVSYVGL